jgi:hypothetical protein
MKQEKKNRSVDRMARLDLNNFDGDLIERWKANVLNKKIGIIMVLHLMDWFNITIHELENRAKSDIDEELEFQKKIVDQAHKID